MKKLIDIPDEYLQELKITAAEANNSAKGWIENVIISKLSIKLNERTLKKKKK